MIPRSPFGAVLLAGGLAACAPTPTPGPTPGPETDAAMAGVEPPAVADALAWVGEQPVREAEVDFFLEHRLNLLPFQAETPELRRRALESLVTGRAMATLMEAELDADERARLDMEVAFFREDLLTKRYLAAFAQPRPVSEAQVVDYYQRHGDEFGARVVREIEWLSTPEGLEPDVRESLLPLFQTLAERGDWQRVAAAENRQSQRLEYRRGVFAASLLAPRLREVVAATPVGSVSGLHLVSGRLHRVRVLEERSQPARPLDEVRADIRKRLAPIAMRESVRAAADAVLGKVEVRYAQDEDAAGGGAVEDGQG